MPYLDLQSEVGSLDTNEGRVVATLLAPQLLGATGDCAPVSRMRAQPIPQAVLP